MSERVKQISELVGKLLNEGIDTEEIILNLVACVYDSMACPDCRSEIILSRQIKALDLGLYTADIVHDDTCPAIKDCDCGHCGD